MACRRNCRGTTGLVFYADILVPVLGTSKLAESNAGIAVKICIDQLCSQIVTDRRDSLPRNTGTVHILFSCGRGLAFVRTDLALWEDGSLQVISTGRVCTQPHSFQPPKSPP